MEIAATKKAERATRSMPLSRLLPVMTGDVDVDDTVVVAVALCSVVALLKELLFIRVELGLKLRSLKEFGTTPKLSTDPALKIAAVSTSSIFEIPIFVMVVSMNVRTVYCTYRTLSIL